MAVLLSLTISCAHLPGWSDYVASNSPDGTYSLLFRHNEYWLWDSITLSKKEKTGTPFVIKLKGQNRLIEVAWEKKRACLLKCSLFQRTIHSVSLESGEFSDEPAQCLLPLTQALRNRYGTLVPDASQEETIAWGCTHAGMDAFLGLYGKKYESNQLPINISVIKKLNLK